MPIVVGPSSSGTITVTNTLDCLSGHSLFITKLVNNITSGSVANYIYTVATTSTTPTTTINNVTQPVYENQTVGQGIVLDGSTCMVTEDTSILPVPANACPAGFHPVWSTNSNLSPTPPMFADATVTVTNTLDCQSNMPPKCTAPMVPNAAGVCICPPPNVMNAAGVCVPPASGCLPPLVRNAAGVCMPPPTGCLPPLVRNAAGVCAPPPTGCLPPMVMNAAGVCVYSPPPVVCSPPKVPGPVAGQCICGSGYTQRGSECVKQTQTQTVCRSPAKANRRGGCDCPRNMDKEGNGCVPKKRQGPTITPKNVIDGIGIIRGLGGGGGGGVRGGGGGGGGPAPSGGGNKGKP